MGLSIISENPIDTKDSLGNIVYAIVNSPLELKIRSQCMYDGCIELVISGGCEEEYLLMDVIPKNEQILYSDPELNPVFYNEKKYFMIAGTSDAYLDDLIYDFSLAYLTLNPKNIIVIHSSLYIALEDIKKIKGYFTGWMNTIKNENT